MEDTDPSLHLQSEYPYPNGFLRVLPLQSECLYPNGFLRVLPLSTRLFLCEPRILVFELGERLGNIRCVRLLSVVPPVLGLPFLPCGFVASIVPLARGKVHPGR